jgi:hypothetical protein
MTLNAGTKTLTVGTGLAYSIAQSLVIANDVDHHLHGTVVSYNPTTGVLVVDHDKHTGTGTFSSWSVNLDGVIGSEPITNVSLPLSLTSGTLSVAAATTSAAGSMSSSDKTILDNLNTGYKVISKQTLSVATASVDINPTGYSLIRIVIIGKGESNSAITFNMRMTINNSIASEYYLNGVVTAATVFSAGSLPGSLTNSNRNGYWDCDLIIGGPTKGYTQGILRNIYQASNASSGTSTTTNALYYSNDSSAITSILVRLNGSNLAIGTQIIVLGVA